MLPSLGALRLGAPWVLGALRRQPLGPPWALVGELRRQPLGLPSRLRRLRQLRQLWQRLPWARLSRLLPSA